MVDDQKQGVSGERPDPTGGTSVTGSGNPAEQSPPPGGDGQDAGGENGETGDNDDQRASAEADQRGYGGAAGDDQPGE